MKVLVIGATGSVGRHLVDQALERGHEVTAFVRDPAKLDVEHERLRVVRGDVLEPATVTPAVAGQEAVLLTLGGGLSAGVRSEGTANVVRAMERARVRRLVCQTTLGVGESRDNLNFYWKYLMFGLLLRRAFADHGLQETYVKESDLDWTIVRPGAFTDGPRTGEYRHGFATDDRSISLDISREDVAEFMVDQLEVDTYLHRTPGLSY